MYNGMMSGDLIQFQNMINRALSPSLLHNCEDGVGRVPLDGKEGRCGWLVSTARIFTNAANATNDDDDDDDGDDDNDNDEAVCLKHTFTFHFYP